MPVVRVLDRGAQRRVDPEPPRRLEVDVGRRLAARDLLRGHDDGITSCRPAASSTTSISSGFDDDATASGQRSATAAHRVDRAGDQRRRLAVAREHPLDDRGVDLLGRPGNAELVRHVTRPLERAHAHHVARRSIGVRAADARACSARAPRPTPARSRRSRRPCRRRPRRSHGLVRAMDVGERVGGSALLDRLHLADEERVVTRAMLVDGARDRTSPPRPSSRRGSSSRTSMPFQSTIGGTLRAKCWARCSWSPERIDAAHSSALRSSSCSDACVRDRDADERRVERQRDERRDGQRGTSPVDLGDDDRDAGGPPPEERPLLGPEVLPRGRA